MIDVAGADSIYANYAEKIPAIGLPGVVLLLCLLMLLYRMLTESYGDVPIVDFLAQNLCQMLPLAALKFKISECADRVTILSRFATKTLLMHLYSLFLRISIVTFFDSPYSEYAPGAYYFNLISLGGVSWLLVTSFNFKFAEAFNSEHRETLLLVVFALVVSVLMNSSVGGTKQLEWTMVSCINNTEVVAFMPAVWMLYQMNRSVEVFVPLPDSSARARAMHFMQFLVAFYLYEDIFSPLLTVTDEPLLVWGHVLHLVLLLDFGLFFLFQTYGPKSAKPDPVHLNQFADTPLPSNDL
eukprot:gnl/MRDRNA2_/MRDRNA2_70206_c0_seq1.p1 gnl/MRDRNA2_/MRDRNA2_70206_c0~~gnl/MRDRNA2_/MRDRNA2_70206_c0_seq1.p1  ORF type:complete len:322 (-),score=29.67 gnl/MRDRNA2_/MRDRNA2_70206_c0_seq1:30-920(-)